jgi:tryptophan-rich sensory protein
MSNTLKLIIAVAVPQLVGITSWLATVHGTREWYPTLVKPWFNPPSWVFGPVWTILYFLMGVAAYLVWRKGLEESGVKTALVLFSIQLGLNGIWSLLFFGMHSPCLAMIEIVLLWCAIVATLIAFLKQSKAAGVLLIPYWAWVSFAVLLNFSLWTLNA